MKVFKLKILKSLFLTLRHTCLEYQKQPKYFDD